MGEGVKDENSFTGTVFVVTNKSNKQFFTFRCTIMNVYDSGCIFSCLTWST